MHIQISYESGSMNEKTLGLPLSGCLIIILIPKLINGLEKSTTFSRDAVMVNGATARSASCQRTVGFIIHYITLQYITLYHITLHHIRLYHITLHYIKLHYIISHYITLQ